MPLHTMNPIKVVLNINLNIITSGTYFNSVQEDRHYNNMPNIILPYDVNPQGSIELKGSSNVDYCVFGLSDPS